jgi:hypothetical protein
VSENLSASVWSLQSYVVYVCPYVVYVCPILPKAVTCLHIIMHCAVAIHSYVEISERFSNCKYISAILRHEYAKQFHIYEGQVAWQNKFTAKLVKQTPA